MNLGELIHIDCGYILVDRVTGVKFKVVTQDEIVVPAPLKISMMEDYPEGIKTVVSHNDRETFRREGDTFWVYANSRKAYESSNLTKFEIDQDFQNMHVLTCENLVKLSDWDDSSKPEEPNKSDELLTIEEIRELTKVNNLEVKLKEVFKEIVKRAKLGKNQVLVDFEAFKIVRENLKSRGFEIQKTNDKLVISW